MFLFQSDKESGSFAKATYILHRLIMRIVEIDLFSVSMGIFGFFQKCKLSTPLGFIRSLSKSMN